MCLRIPKASGILHLLSKLLLQELLCHGNKVQQTARIQLSTTSLLPLNNTHSQQRVTRKQCVNVPGTLLSCSGRCSLLEEGAALLEKRLILVSATRWVNAPVAAQVGVLIVLCLREPGCLAALCLLMSANQETAQAGGELRWEAPGILQWTQLDFCSCLSLSESPFHTCSLLGTNNSHLFILYMANAAGAFSDASPAAGITPCPSAFSPN